MGAAAAVGGGKGHSARPHGRRERAVAGSAAARVSREVPTTDDGKRRGWDARGRSQRQRSRVSPECPSHGKRQRAGRAPREERGVHVHRSTVPGGWVRGKGRAPRSRERVPRVPRTHSYALPPLTQATPTHLPPPRTHQRMQRAGPAHGPGASRGDTLRGHAGQTRGKRLNEGGGAGQHGTAGWAGGRTSSTQSREPGGNAQGVGQRPPVRNAREPADSARP